MYSSLSVVIIFESNSISFVQFKLQFLIVHWVSIDNESLQFNWIIEIISKSWLRRNSIGDNNVDAPGISVTVGDKHAKIINIKKIIFYENNYCDWWWIFLTLSSLTKVVFPLKWIVL